MNKGNHASNSNGSKKPRKQRALVLQGGGTLGAYEAGVLEILCKTLSEEGKGENRDDGMLFDIVAGTSIGAMNGAVLVSNFLNTNSWKKAVEKLQKFWTDQLSVKQIDISEISKPWYSKWKDRVPTAASPEMARRYYSVKSLVLDQVGNNMYYLSETIQDKKFFDNMYLDTSSSNENQDCKDQNRKIPNFSNNDWFVHNLNPLQESIEKYTNLPILTNYEDNQPRFLVVSVDVAEGVTVTFDSYHKVGSSRKSEYKVKNNGKENKIVIKYNDGINIEHIMASGTIPEFYKYAPVHINSIDKVRDEDSNTNAKSIENKDEIRYFTDGGVLSNTPFRELLIAHREYWRDVSEGHIIPDLDVYIINVHASKVDESRVCKDNDDGDYDGVKERHTDLKYGDRTSHYDEENAHLIAHYADFCNQLKELVDYAIDQTTDENQNVLRDNLSRILSTKICNETGISNLGKYEDLPGYAFNLDVALRIERGSYINDGNSKTGDLTLETINKLIKEGKCDAWFSIIEKIIMDMNLDPDNKHTLTSMLDIVRQNLRVKDYEDNDSKAYQSLEDFINMAKVIGKSDNHTDRLVNYTEELKAIIE